jgi:hypothetical protein
MRIVGTKFNAWASWGAAVLRLYKIGANVWVCQTMLSLNPAIWEAIAATGVADVEFYSWRRAMMGSVWMARRAGR